MKYSGIGGQAVMEGIMMRAGDKYSVGVRRPDGSIAVEVFDFTPFRERFTLARVPFVRGSFAFVESMIIGIRTLMFSAEFIEDDEDSEPSRAEIWLRDKLGDKLDKAVISLSVVLAFVLALIIFMWFPLFAAGLLRGFIRSESVIALIEGLLRVAIFIGYIKLISRAGDIRRTFMYHGAEHKCINCIEHGLPLSVDCAMLSSKEHKRCGTSFIIIVMIISILVFMVVRVDNLALRLLTRIILLPVIAGISYEILLLAGRSDHPLVNLISRPGMWMQSLTTYEPDPDMLEVAIAAVEAVFDWKSWEDEAMPAGPDETGGKIMALLSGDSPDDAAGDTAV